MILIMMMMLSELLETPFSAFVEKLVGSVTTVL